MKAEARNFRKELLEAIWLAAVFTLLVLVANGNFAQAQEMSVQGNIVAPVEVAEVPSSKSPFSMRMNLEAASSLHQGGSYERKAETSLEVAPSIGISKFLTLSAVAALSQEFDAARTTTLSNTRISLSRKAIALSSYTLIPALSASAPTNRFAVEDDTYKGGIGLAATLSRDFQAKGLPIIASLRTGFDRNFHGLTLNSSGSANIRDRVREGLNVKWIVGNRISFSLDAMATQAWTYRETVKNRFDLSQELGFDLNEGVAFYIGHSNGGNAYKANGRDSNIALFDTNSSMVRTGASLVF